MPKGKPHPAEPKARVALEVMHDERTVNEVASPTTTSTRTQSGDGLQRRGPNSRASSRRPRTTGRASGSSPSAGRRSMTFIAGLTSSPPSVIIFNGTCLAATELTSRTSLVDSRNAELALLFASLSSARHKGRGNALRGLPVDENHPISGRTPLEK